MYEHVYDERRTRGLTLEVDASLPLQFEEQRNVKGAAGLFVSGFAFSGHALQEPHDTRAPSVNKAQTEIRTQRK